MNYEFVSKSEREVFNNISKGAEIVIEYTAQNILDSTLIHNSKFLILN